MTELTIKADANEKRSTKDSSFSGQDQITFHFTRKQRSPFSCVTSYRDAAQKKRHVMHYTLHEAPHQQIGGRNWIFSQKNWRRHETRNLSGALSRAERRFHVSRQNDSIQRLCLETLTYGGLLAFCIRIKS